MTGRVGAAMLVGSIVFLVITAFEQLPVIGWLGALVSIGAWIWLAGEIRRAGGTMTDAAIGGAVTGLIGAVSGWVLQVGNLFGPDTPGLARFGAGSARSERRCSSCSGRSLVRSYAAAQPRCARAGPRGAPDPKAHAQPVARAAG